MASTMGTARGTTQGSWRPRAISSTSSPARLTVFCLRDIVDVGLNAMRATMCSPLDRPPWMPPDLCTSRAQRLNHASVLVCKWGKAQEVAMRMAGDTKLCPDACKHPFTVGGLPQYMTAKMEEAQGHSAKGKSVLPSNHSLARLENIYKALFALMLDHW